MTFTFDEAYDRAKLQALKNIVLDNPSFPEKRDSLDRLNSLIKAVRIKPIAPKPQSSLFIVLNRLQVAGIDCEENPSND